MKQDTAESPFREFAEVGKSFGKSLKATVVAVLQRTASSRIFGHLRKPKTSVFGWRARERGGEGKGWRWMEWIDLIKLRRR